MWPATSDGGERGRCVEMGVDGQDAVDAPGAQKVGIGRDQVLAMAVMDGEIEVVLAYEKVAYAGEHLGVVAFAKLGEKDADRLHALALEGAGDHAGLVVEFCGGGLDAVTRRFWNGAAGGIVEDVGDGGRTEVKVLGQHFEAGGAAIRCG